MRSHHHEKHEAYEVNNESQAVSFMSFAAEPFKPIANAKADMHAMLSSMEQSSLTLNSWTR